MSTEFESEVFPELEREPMPDAEAPAVVAPPPAALPTAPVHPEAERGTSDGTLVCTVCLRLIGAGETYVQTAVRGTNHLEPCSHRS